MIWLLGEPGDVDLLWLAATLQRRGVSSTVLLPEELLIGSALSVRIDRNGSAAYLKLQDGRTLGADSAGVVLNRLMAVPTVARAADAGDALYIGEEWQASIAAWLRALRCPVLNPPRAGSLSGPMLFTPTWRRIGEAHGLRTAPWSSGDFGGPLETVELVCLGSRSFCTHAAVPAEIEAALARMARSTGLPLLGATFALEGERWLFLDATPLPRLMTGGAHLVDALIACAHAGQVPQ